MRKKDRTAMISRYLSGPSDDEVDVTRFVEREVDLAVRRARRKWLLKEISFDKIHEERGARKLRDKIVRDLRVLAAKHFRPWTETLALRYERGEEGQQ